MKKFQDYLIKDNINEDIMSSLKSKAGDLGTMVQNLFKKKGGWLYGLLQLQKKNKFPQGIEIFRFAGPKEPPQEYLTTSESYVRELDVLSEEKIELEHPSKRVENVDGKELVEILDDHFHNKHPIFIWGAPGIGKTDIVKQVAQKNGVDLIVFNLSMRDPVDYLGLPSIARSSPEIQAKTGLMGQTTYNPPKVWPLDNGPEDKGGILFFDEMNRANPSVLNASLQLVLDRQAGEYKLPSKWVIFAAGNRKGEAPDVTNLDPALANRFAMYNFVPKFKDFEKWAQETRTEKGENVVDPRILAFLNFSQEFLHNFDTSYADTDASPWPSPRSWAKATAAINEKTSRIGRDLTDKELERIVAGAVGKDVAVTLMEFLSVSKHFSIEDLDKILTNGNKAPLPPSDHAPTIAAILSSIAYKLKNKKITLDEWKQIVKYAIRIPNAEWAMSFVSWIIKDHDELAKNPETFEIFREFEYHVGPKLGHEVGEETKAAIEKLKNSAGKEPQ